VPLLDEPFGALDAIARRRVRDELADLLCDAAPSERARDARVRRRVALSHRVGVLDRGQLVQLGSPEELVQQPAVLQSSGPLVFSAYTESSADAKYTDPPASASEE
jgi:ABC-type proline/glycine betaine transport system ATPase subunit